MAERTDLAIEVIRALVGMDAETRWIVFPGGVVCARKGGHDNLGSTTMSYWISYGLYVRFSSMVAPSALLVIVHLYP